MKTFFLTIIFLSILDFEGNCQSNYPLPAGYSIFKDSENKPFRLDGDLDGDSINDLVIVYFKTGSEDDNIVAVYLSSIYNKTKTYHYFPLNALGYSMEIKKQVLRIGWSNGTGRYFRGLKFKFYPALKTMRLIGYDEEHMGNAVHDGAYLKSVNLLTNKYEISGARWKNKIVKAENLRLITLDKFDEKSLDYLENIGASYKD